VVSIPVLYISGREVDLEGVYITISIAAIVTPIICWYLIGLLLEIYRLENEQRELATYDQLTGIMTRRAFLENCETILKIVQRNKQLMSLAYIDIDDFKEINDTCGHEGGDEVLKSFALCLQEHLRESDLLGRIGGEEFVIALVDTNIEQSIFVLDKIRLSTEKNGVSLSNLNLHYTVSIGVVLFDNNNRVDLQELIRQSDSALYKAKKAGKNCIVEYSSS